MSALPAKQIHPIRDHLIWNLMDSEVRPVPFPHVYVTRVFPLHYYKEILANLPPDEAYTDRTYDNRAMVSTRDLNTPFWKDLTEWMANYELVKAVLDVFGIKHNPKLDIRLVRDRSGYSIKPHTDVQRKLISLLFYLAEDESHQEDGTSVMVPVNQGFTSDGKQRYEFEDFRIVYTAPFMPNTMFGFPRSDVSFHGVLPTSLAVRNTLLLNLYR